MSASGDGEDTAGVVLGAGVGPSEGRGPGATGVHMVLGPLEIWTPDRWCHRLLRYAADGSMEVDASLACLPVTEHDLGQWVNGVLDGRVRYTDRWYFWNPPVWTEDPAEVVVVKVMEVLADEYREAVRMLGDAFKSRSDRVYEDLVSVGKTEEEAKAEAKKKSRLWDAMCTSFRKFSARLLFTAGREAMVRQLSGVCRIPLDAFDSDVRWLSFQNGVMDLDALRQKMEGGWSPGLSDLELLPCSPDRLITQCMGVAWNPGAETVVFDSFLDSMFPDSKDKIRFVLRLVGGSLLGIPEKRVADFYGPTNSGKSTLFGALGVVCGSYLKSANVELFTMTNQRDAFEMDDLRTARIVVTAEPGQGAQWDDSRVKKVSGRDPVDSRGFRRSKTDSGGSWIPRFLLMLATNFDVKFHTEDRALIKRLTPVICPVGFRDLLPGEVAGEGSSLAVGNMMELLIEAGEGIAVRLVEGMLARIRCDVEGTTGSEPVDVSRARSDMVIRLDTVQEWVRAAVMTGLLAVTSAATDEIQRQPWATGGLGVLPADRGLSPSASDAYAVYLRWFYESDLDRNQPKLLAAFGKSMHARFGRDQHPTTRRTTYPGLMITTLWEETVERARLGQETGLVWWRDL